MFTIGGCCNRASKLLAPRLVLTLVVERVTFFPRRYIAKRIPNTRATPIANKFEIFELPLIHRKGKVTASLDDLKQWRVWARNCAEQASDKFQPSQSYALPKIESLYLEIDLILQDVIVTDLREDSGDLAYRPEHWNSSGNRLCSKRNILLREGLSELQLIWERRLIDRVPLQYITATCYWRDLVLLVTPAVLIPRPETELMIDLVQTAMLRSLHLCNLPWLDLGTGSGALAISLAAEIDKVRKLTDLPEGKEVYVHAVEISKSAAEVARYNIKRFESSSGKRNLVRVHEGSWFEPLKSTGILQSRAGLEEQHIGTIGGIVSNPPYIPHTEMSNLQPEVRYHEPWLALEGGWANGLEYFDLICKGAAQHLLPGGYLLLETSGGGQVKDVLNLIASLKNYNPQNGREIPIFEHVRAHVDYNGVERYVSAWKRNDN